MIAQTYDRPLHLRVWETQAAIHDGYTAKRRDWKKLKALMTYRDELLDRVAAKAPRNMFSMTREMRLDALDLVHRESQNYTTSGLRDVVRTTFGVKPSGRTIRRWVAEEVCRNELCDCQRGALFNELIPGNFLFFGADEVTA